MGNIANLTSRPTTFNLPNSITLRMNIRRSIRKEISEPGFQIN